MAGSATYIPYSIGITSSTLITRTDTIRIEEKNCPNLPMLQLSLQ